MVYIPGEDNTVADALSRVPVNGFPNEVVRNTHGVWTDNVVSAVLQLQVDESVLKEIIAGYDDDEFAKHALADNIPGFRKANGLLYVSSRLVIPRVGNIQENLFRMAHNCLGHFGADKSYAAL